MTSPQVLELQSYVPDEFRVRRICARSDLSYLAGVLVARTIPLASIDYPNDPKTQNTLPRAHGHAESLVSSTAKLGNAESAGHLRTRCWLTRREAGPVPGVSAFMDPRSRQQRKRRSGPRASRWVWHTDKPMPTLLLSPN